MAMMKIAGTDAVGTLTFPVYKYTTNVVKNLLKKKLYYGATFAFHGRMYGIGAYDESSGLLYLYEFKPQEDSEKVELCGAVYDPVADEIFDADIVYCGRDMLVEWRNSEGEECSTRFIGWCLAKSPT